MMNNEDNSGTAQKVVGPERVIIRVTSPQGPFAAADSKLAAPPTKIWLVNPGVEPLALSELALDPLQNVDGGSVAVSPLAIEAATPTIAPGQGALATISGDVPAQPGVYESRLRIARGTSECVSPVEVRVGASAIWGFACMVVGLLLVGVINALDSESGVKGDLRGALETRQSTHELLQQKPAPQSSAVLVENINREFDAAVAILQKPREISFIDRRSSDARERLKAAEDLNLELRKLLSDKPRGGAEVADLENEWKSTKEDFAALTRLLLAPAAGGQSLTQRLGTFDAWAAQRLLRLPLDYLTREFDYHVARVRLMREAGRGQDAADDAVAVRRWMERGAETINKNARTVTTFVQISANNIATAERVRRFVAVDGFPPDQRAAVLRALDSAAAMLVEPFNWPMRREVAQRIEAARTQTLRNATQAMLAAVSAAAAREQKEDSIESVQAVIDEGEKLKRGPDRKIDPKEKAAWLQRCVAAWRARLATLPDPNALAGVAAEVDAIEAANEENDFEAVRTHLRRLSDAWKSYTAARSNALMRKATASFCVQLRSDALGDLEAVQQAMRQLEETPAVAKWESERDLLRMKIDATPDLEEKMGQDCMDVLIDLTGRAYRLNSEVFGAIWSATVLPDVEKRTLTDNFASILTPEALANLRSDVRPLRIEITTPVEERYVDREIEFNVRNLGPNWGPGVTLRVDFGDHAIVERNAEELRKNALTHSYKTPETFTVDATALESTGGRVPGPKQSMLGRAEPVSLVIAPSPVSLARDLADYLFNLRFGLALIIASLLYYWRYSAQKSAFGARSFDYAEAFALGFAVSLAVDRLADKLADFALLKG